MREKWEGVESRDGYEARARSKLGFKVGTTQKGIAQTNLMTPASFPLSPSACAFPVKAAALPGTHRR